MNPNDAVQRKTALVIGANGVIGRNLIGHLATLPEWDIIGVSRRGGVNTGRVRYIAADLLDPEKTRLKLGTLPEVTHIFYAAYQDRPTWAELVPPNLAMLVNTV
ncbi:NAD-dependent dehydratase, partial [Paenibacillus riograndensis]